MYEQKVPIATVELRIDWKYAHVIDGNLSEHGGDGVTFCWEGEDDVYWNRKIEIRMGPV